MVCDIIKDNMHGIPALRIYYDTAIKGRMKIAERKTYELHSMSPFLTLERGFYRIFLCSRTLEGRFFVLWRKRDEKWTIIEECRQ